MRPERYLRTLLLEFLKLSKEFGLYFISIENTVEGLGKGGRFFTKCGLD